MVVNSNEEVDYPRSYLEDVIDRVVEELEDEEFEEGDLQEIYDENLHEANDSMESEMQYNYQFENYDYDGSETTQEENLTIVIPLDQAPPVVQEIGYVNCSCCSQAIYNQEPHVFQEIVPFTIPSSWFSDQGYVHCSCCSQAIYNQEPHVFQEIVPFTILSSWFSDQGYVNCSCCSQAIYNQEPHVFQEIVPYTNPSFWFNNQVIPYWHYPTTMDGGYAYSPLVQQGFISPMQAYYYWLTLQVNPGCPCVVVQPYSPSAFQEIIPSIPDSSPWIALQGVPSCPSVVLHPQSPSTFQEIIPSIPDSSPWIAMQVMSTPIVQLHSPSSFQITPASSSWASSEVMPCCNCADLHSPYAIHIIPSIPTSSPWITSQVMQYFSSQIVHFHSPSPFQEITPYTPPASTALIILQVLPCYSSQPVNLHNQYAFQEITPPSRSWIPSQVIPSFSVQDVHFHGSATIQEITPYMPASSSSQGTSSNYTLENQSFSVEEIIPTLPSSSLWYIPRGMSSPIYGDNREVSLSDWIYTYLEEGSDETPDMYRNLWENNSDGNLPNEDGDGVRNGNNNVQGWGESNETTEEDFDVKPKIEPEFKYFDDEME